MKKILKTNFGKNLVIATLTLSTILSFSGCTTPQKTEEVILPPIENTQPNETNSPFDSYSQEIPERANTIITSVYEQLINLSYEDKLKLVEESFYINNQYTKPESYSEFLETLKTENFNKDFGKEPVTFVEEENLDLNNKNPTYISLSNNEFSLKRIMYSANDIWGYLNGNLYEETQDKFVYNGLVVSFAKGIPNYSIDPILVSDIYVNIGDYVFTIYFDDFNNQDFKILSFNNLFKIKDITFEDYAKEYGVEDLSLIGWTDSILDNINPTSSNIKSKTKDDREL